ncbi:MAG: helix-hairpin-helix domain-containing protein [Balneolales bacterium]
MSTNKKLPVKPDKINLELLSRAKLFLDHSHSHATSNSTLDRMVAIHGMDNAIEFLLKIIARHLDFESVQNQQLPDDLAGMAGVINKFLTDHYNYRLSYLEEIKILRKVRNLVQHGASDPAPEMERFVSFTSRFFIKTVENIFGIESNELKISQLIKDPTVKKHLSSAEKYFQSENYLKSIVASRDAFENALFVKKKNDRIRLDPSPILTNTKKDDSVFSQYFYRNIATLIEINNLGIDYTKFNRYKELVDHIPSRYNATSWGHAVMQRPWENEDALFIYSFASNYIYKWQSQELEPLYELGSEFHDYEIQESIAGIKLLEDSHAYSYFDERQEIQIFYVDAKTKEALSKLEEGKVYKYHSNHLKKGVLESEFNYNILLHKLLYNLETNNPPRWEIILKYSIVPLTWHRKEYRSNKIIKETASLNDSSTDELVKIDKIGKKTAQKIISYRNKKGKFKSGDDVKKVEGLSYKQIDELLKYTRI